MLLSNVFFIQITRKYNKKCMKNLRINLLKVQLKLFLLQISPILYSYISGTN